MAGEELCSFAALMRRTCGDGPLDGRADAAQDLRHLLDVADVGDVAEDAVFGDEQRGGHRAHCGVLGAADVDGAAEGMAALDY